MNWYYAVFCKDRKLKNIFEKIIYKIWLLCGVSPSGIMNYITPLGENIISKKGDKKCLKISK